MVLRSFGQRCLLAACAATSAAAVLAAAIAAACALQQRSRLGSGKDSQGQDETEDSKPKSSAKVPGKAKAKASQKSRDKGAERLEWWQRLNQVKPVLTVPERQVDQIEASSAALAALAGVLPEAAHVHQEVARVVQDRLGRGRDWLVRDSDYPADGSTPAHAGVKAKVNAAIKQAIVDVFGESLPDILGADPQTIILLLDTPQYGTFRNIVDIHPKLRCCQQVVIPQADLQHYFEMTRAGDFYPGVRAQRLDHWLCANSRLGLRSLVAFLDYECRLVGSLSAKLCPAADIMRYFRFGYPAEPVGLLALTVGLEEPAPTPETVDAFVRWEAALNGYTVELRETWKYRMVTLLYVVRRSSKPILPHCDTGSASRE